MKILKKGREERINERLRKLRSRYAYSYFVTHTEFPLQEKERDEFKITAYLSRIEEITPQIESLLREYRKYIPHIWDQNKYSASYLLICKAYSNLKMLIVLAKKGSNQELVEICRSAVESLDLVHLFLEDDKGKLLRDWFRGKIIANKEARKVIHKVLNQENKGKDAVPLKDVKSDVYETYSLYSHSSYAALLDSVDVFYEDYDFKKYAGFHYTADYLHLIKNVIVNILLNLKSVFIQVKDIKSLEATDNLMRTIGYKKLSRESIDEFFKDYKK